MNQDNNQNIFNENPNNSTTIGGVTFGGGIQNASPQYPSQYNSNLPPSSHDPFLASSTSSPFGENGFSQAISSGNPNSNNQFAQQAIANAAALSAKQASKDQKFQFSNPSPQENVPLSTLNIPVASPTHFDLQTQNNNQPADNLQLEDIPNPVDLKNDPKTIAMKSLKKMTTMSLVFGILAVVFLALSIIGLVFGMSQVDKLAVANKTISDKDKIIKAVEETTGVSNISKPEDVPVYKATTGYIYLTDWKIKIKIPESLTSVSYVLNNYEFRNSICFNAVQKGVQYKPSFADPGKNLGRQGCIARVPVTDGDFDATSGIRFGTKVFTYKDFNFFYVNPIDFSTDGAELGLEHTADQLIKNMITDNIEPYE